MSNLTERQQRNLDRIVFAVTVFTLIGFGVTIAALVYSLVWALQHVEIK